MHNLMHSQPLEDSGRLRVSERTSYLEKWGQQATKTNKGQCLLVNEETTTVLTPEIHRTGSWLRVYFILWSTEMRLL